MTPQQVKARFALEGFSIAEWARARGYKLRTVYSILNGKRKCNRGIGHRIAVDLGLKREPRRLMVRMKPLTYPMNVVVGEPLSIDIAMKKPAA
jgi:gp16 family phage-associated protein